MPNYYYRHPRGSCPGGSKYQEFSEDPLTDCPRCGVSGVYRSIQMSQFRLRHGMKGDMRDYREDLSRFSNDPEAYVDGPRALKNLIEKRKREGWQMSTARVTPTIPTHRPSEEVVREAYRRAEAKGFIPDASE
jgi:predicted nucleic acid-binding Zn ribbon protein